MPYPPASLVIHTYACLGNDGPKPPGTETFAKKEIKSITSKTKLPLFLKI